MRKTQSDDDKKKVIRVAIHSPMQQSILAMKIKVFETPENSPIRPAAVAEKSRDYCSHLVAFLPRVAWLEWSRRPSLGHL